LRTNYVKSELASFDGSIYVAVKAGQYQLLAIASTAVRLKNLSHSQQYEKQQLSPEAFHDQFERQMTHSII
jgi:hypothetical protein